MDKEQWKGNMDLMILSLLKNEDMYGFMIINTVNQITGTEFELSEGTLYSVLKRLDRKKIIESYWGEGGKGARRKYYRITALGEELHQEKLNNWKLINKIIEEVNKG
ncbi:PadR family transcriptional regulator [Alkalihalophilus lindianensis]|uniref:PadR family transcriptional regulator n=1 Tax=Alkalihalophilus lindianensis TaxID=1630542 RepID=A0ABU3X973_9BACI|nr:PadR family transcriptional regulator [Alkalihalophilus lindianensis]MDV2684428.1 PadR family transcriptional regulator [Alkalihalophilus lindianensis]